MQYVPTIYGFKIFSQKGSKFELVYDNMGQAKNQKEVDTILKKKTGVASQGGMISPSGGSMIQSTGGPGEGGMLISKPR